MTSMSEQGSLEDDFIQADYLYAYGNCMCHWGLFFFILHCGSCLISCFDMKEDMACIDYVLSPISIHVVDSDINCIMYSVA